MRGRPPYGPGPPPRRTGARGRERRAGVPLTCRVNSSSSEHLFAMRVVASASSVMDTLGTLVEDAPLNVSVATCGITDGSAARLNLVQLPADALLRILSHVNDDLLCVSPACRTLYELVEYRSLWEPLLLRRHRLIIDAYFDGVVPPPPCVGCSWKRHALEFDREWLDAARRRSGRSLLRMDSSCCLADPQCFGVPTPPCDVWLTLRVPILDAALRFNVGGLVLFLDFVLPFDLGNWFGAQRPAFGIHDVTDFLDAHPGADQLLLDASRSDDCTAAFDDVGHTERARSILRRLVVPGLEALPPQVPLARPRPSADGSRTGAASALRALRALPALLRVWCSWCSWAAVHAAMPSVLGGRSVSAELDADDAARSAPAVESLKDGGGE